MDASQSKKRPPEGLRRGYMTIDLSRQKRNGFQKSSMVKEKHWAISGIIHGNEWIKQPFLRHASNAEKEALKQAASEPLGRTF